LSYPDELEESDQAGDYTSAQINSNERRLIPASDLREKAADPVDLEDVYCARFSPWYTFDGNVDETPEENTEYDHQSGGRRQAQLGHGREHDFGIKKRNQEQEE